MRRTVCRRRKRFSALTFPFNFFLFFSCRGEREENRGNEYHITVIHDCRSKVEVNSSTFAKESSISEHALCLQISLSF
ncbi:hypothetical protein GLYMA_15G122701v4 [Glycine max]|nr:hypothetical protein GLYMA_15G122701v4 [Glycine max]KAH1146809.1 hypothetical protein GYH30_042136 [Glycine max]